MSDSFPSNLTGAEIARSLVLAPRLDRAQVQAWFQALNFEEPEPADRRFQQLAGSPPLRETFADIAPLLLCCLRDCPAPDQALKNLVRFVERGDPQTLYRFWRDDPGVLDLLVTLMSASQLLADTLIRNPEYLFSLLEGDPLAREKDKAQMAAELAQRVGRFQTLEAQQNALRRYKRQEFLRIGARDLLGRADLKAVTRELSALAEAELCVALDCVKRDLQARKLAPFPAPPLAVIGMGKLGAEELNYNSDIDVMFVYEEARGKEPSSGERGPCASCRELKPSLSDREYCDRLARGVLRAIGERTAEGRVFRVDARLRPEGEQGPLVRSLDGYLNYYEAWSEPWESQALLKARAVAGDADLGQRFNALARAVAYGRRLDLAAITSIRENKRRSEELVARGRPGNHQVKQGYGGIRDIEFTVQLLQLVHGLEDPRVRGGNTLEALENLAWGGYLTESEREVLESSYIFLRRVEHHLQMQQEVPSPFLPDKPSELRALAKRMGYFDGAWTPATERFRDAYRWHTEQVRSLCEKLFFHPLPGRGAASDPKIQLLLDPLVQHAEGAVPLLDLGFQDPAQARRRLIFLAYGEPPMRLPERVQRVFVEVLPQVLKGVAGTPDPDRAIRNFERFLSAAGGREMFYEFLRDQPGITKLLCRIGGFSEPLSRTLIDHPEYLDIIADRSIMAEPKDKAAFRADLSQRLGVLGSPHLQWADLRRYKRREMFRLGVRDLTHAADLETTLGEISDLADVCLEKGLEICLSSGSPDLRFAVLGLGKWGGRELHYSSDLDLLLVYAPPDRGGAAARTAAFQAAEKLARDLLKAVGERTRDGMVFEVDARLRPYGKEGQMVRTVESYRDYYAQRGEPWERLALTRARFVAGDVSLGEELLEVLRQAAFRPGFSASDRAQVQHLRQRIATEHRTGGPEALDLKLAPGGILDLEFLVQVLQLEHGWSCPDICLPNTLAALRALGDAGFLAPEEAAFLEASYRHLRLLEMRLQLVSEQSSAVLGGDERSWAAAARRLEYSGDSEAERAARLRQDCATTLSGVREIYERIVGVDGILT